MNLGSEKSTTMTELQPEDAPGLFDKYTNNEIRHVPFVEPCDRFIE